ncbi:MAG TPA: DNA polymerase III subunit chi [Aestuariivirgaceae bacterium]|jgi:DNA polymerase-3 subunit chi
MTEILFYHLEQQPLTRVLPQLISKTLERGWRAVIHAGSEERVEAISAALWVTGEESFLPHGTASDGNADLQPIWITDKPENPNRANVCFLVDRAKAPDLGAFDRVVFLIDGKDAEAVEEARGAWTASQAVGHIVTYWREDSQGRWQKQG